MSVWTLKDILDHVQELVGEPIGGFFNISARLRLINQAQREMVLNTKALTFDAKPLVTAGDPEVPLPMDFLTFGKEQPYFVESLQGRTHKLEVVDPGLMDDQFPHWRDSSLSHTSIPRYLVHSSPVEVYLYPVPGVGGTLVIPYVVEPDELRELGDEVFNGVEMMSVYAPALAYKVAATHLTVRAPQLAQQYMSTYYREMRQLRHDIRVSSQRQGRVRPRGYERRTSRGEG